MSKIDINRGKWLKWSLYIYKRLFIILFLAPLPRRQAGVIQTMKAQACLIGRQARRLRQQGLPDPDPSAILFVIFILV